MGERIAWAGIVDGEIDCREVDTGFGGYGTGNMAVMFSLFRTRKEARARYEKVVKIILPAPPQ